MATIEFYPFDVGHKAIDGKTYVILFGRTASAVKDGQLQEGKQIIVLEEYSPYFYVQLKNDDEIEHFIRKAISLTAETAEKESKIRKLATSAEQLSKEFNGAELQLVKITAPTQSDLDVLADVIKDWPEVKEIFEHDINLPKKYLVDKGILPMVMCTATGEEEQLKDQFKHFKAKAAVLRATSVAQNSTQIIESPRILAFDIETYNPAGKAILPDENPIIMAAFAGTGTNFGGKSGEFRKVITWKRFKTDEPIEFVDSEAELIMRLKQMIENYKPDIISGYFSDGFDFPYLATRAAKHKIKLDIGLDYSELSINRRGEFPTAQIAGIPHLDVFKFVRRIMGPSLDTESYRLDYVAHELLGERKDDIQIDGLAKAWDESSEALEKFCKYNLKDAVLTMKLAHKIMPNILELIKLVGLPLFDINRQGFSQLVEWYLIRQSRMHKQLVPNKPAYQEISARKAQTFTGAFVYEPKPGLYDDIIVYDFRSLYPSIISSHNLSPGTLKCECCGENPELVPFEKERLWFCKRKKGFIPKIIEDIISRRTRVKEIIREEKKRLIERPEESSRKEKKQQDSTLQLLDARQNSLKLLANSFYGYLGFFAARWYSLESAKATTAFGRHYITMVIDEAKKTGFNVLYSDTDSIFLSLAGKKREDSKRFAELINMKLPGIMELEFEGYYPKGLFVFTKSSIKEIDKSSRTSEKETGVGAKKKYALLTEDGSLKIKGFETVRRNSSIIAKETQEKILGMVLRGEDSLQYARQVVRELQENKTPLEKVVIHTQLTKDISTYDSVGPHVAVAQRMQAKGIPVGGGSIIKFVIAKGAGIIRDRARMPDEITQQDYDSAYYINNQIIPVVERILNLVGHTKEDILNDMTGSRQKGLMSFFGK